MSGTESIRPIWQAAIDRYYSQLEEGGMKRTPVIEKDLWAIESPNVLIEEIQQMVPQESTLSKAWMTVLPKVEPMLSSLNDFAAVVAWSLGMNGRVAAILWGSIRLLLKFAHPVFPQLIAMLQALRTVLPKARLSEQEFPFSESLNAALLDMYTEIIIFYAYSITFFRNNPNAVSSKNAWSTFSARFEKVIAKLRVSSRKVDEIVDMMRLSKEVGTSETVNAIQGLHNLMIADSGTKCYAVPYGLNLKFYGRSIESEELRKSLNPGKEDLTRTLKVVSICGLGGVGKTQLALHYANASRDLYYAIAWIQADTQTKFIQSLSNFASKLGLPMKEGSGNDDYQSVQKVRDWLNSSDRTFLLIFDNLDDALLLGQIWPASNKGSIIITSRSPAVASRRATKTIHLKSFEPGEALNILCEMTGIQPTNEEDTKAAQAICQLIGGLPLAMVHMSSFIQDRGYSYGEFLGFYKKHAERIFVKNQSQADYDNTLNTVWDLAIQSLSPNAHALLTLLSYFDPDSIPETLLTGTKAEIVDPRLQFLEDEFDFGDAVSELMTKTSLIDRLSSSKSLSMHRLVKFAVFMRVPEDDRTLYLDSAIQFLSHGFPNTWDQRGYTQGHSYKSWNTSSAIVPHLSSLMGLIQQYNLKATNTEVFAELVFRIGTYLWESEQPTFAKSFFAYGLALDIDQDSRICAQAYRLLGHIGLDIAQPRAALSAYQKAMATRQKIEEPNSPAIAEVYDSIACSYAEIGDVPKALEHLEKANAISLAHYGHPTARTSVIYALAYLRGDQPEKSLEKLLQCWKLSGKTPEEIAESAYPKHSGDIVLYARIHYALGKKEEAQRLASRSINIRRGIYGFKGPRVADSTFLVAKMLVAKGEHIIAARMYGDIIEMSRDMPEMKGHLARAMWFLASMEDLLENPAEAERLRVNAKTERLGIHGRETPDEDTDEAFNSLVGWMLW